MKKLYISASDPESGLWGGRLLIEKGKLFSSSAITHPADITTLYTFWASIREPLKNWGFGLLISVSPPHPSVWHNKHKVVLNNYVGAKDLILALLASGCQSRQNYSEAFYCDCQDGQ